MSQSVSASRSLTFRRRRATVLASIPLLVLAAIFLPNGAVVSNFVSALTGVAMLVAVAMIPKAYALTMHVVHTIKH
jgi:hypothetical protein